MAIFRRCASRPSGWQRLRRRGTWPPRRRSMWPRCGLAPKRAANAQDLAAGGVSHSVDVAAPVENAIGLPGLMPAPPTLSAPPVGGLVGHMLEHQRAAAVRCSRVWSFRPSRSGLVARNDWPPRRCVRRNCRLTRSSRLKYAKQRRAGTSSQSVRSRPGSPKERGDVYAQMLTRCAGCHSLHGVWGLRSPAGVKP